MRVSKSRGWRLAAGLGVCMLIGGSAWAQRTAEAERPQRAHADSGGQARADAWRDGRGGATRGTGDEMLLAAIAANERFAERLGLAEDQVQRLRGAVESSRTEYAALRAQLEAAALQQARIMTAEPVDESALMAAVDTLFDVRAEMAKLKLRQLLMVKAVLTPEQLASARQMMRQRFRMRNGEEDARRGGWRRPEADADGERRPRPLRSRP